MSEKSNKSALPVAYYFLRLAAEQNQEITNLKLQKLVYYAAVWYFTFFNKKLFNDSIEAWMHGPAIPKVYRRFKEFGFHPIEVDGVADYPFTFSKKQRDLLNSVWNVYGKYDAAYLEALTHSELPWREARKNLDPGMPSKRKIDLNKAKCYYASRLKESE